jgi:hypothetical protein
MLIQELSGDKPDKGNSTAPFAFLMYVRNRLGRVWNYKITPGHWF